MSIGYLAESITSTGYEPEHLTEDKDHAEHEDLRVKPFFFHRQRTASTYVSAESIATLPPESDLDDEQIRALLASPLYLQEREANAVRSQVYHSEREHLMSSSSQDPISTGKPVAVFSSQSRLNQDTFPRETNLLMLFFGSNEPIFRFSNPANVAKSLLDGNRDHLIPQARSELMRQEHKLESLYNCINELQQQTYAQRLELQDAHHES